MYHLYAKICRGFWIRKSKYTLSQLKFKKNVTKCQEMLTELFAIMCKKHSDN